MARHIVFFDFDNTITAKDVFDEILLRFSRDNRWEALETRWKKGEISSRECLEAQLKGMDLSKGKIDRYLANVKIDPYFKKLMQFIAAKKMKAVILSDNFDYILKRTLRRNGIRNLKVLANRLEFPGGRLKASFPHRDKKCPTCGHCKTKSLLANSRKHSIIIYIGDGQTDICAAKYADIVFAKEHLLKFYQAKNLACFPYQHLGEVYNYFKRSLA